MADSERQNEQHDRLVRLDTAIRTAFLLLDSLDRRTLAAITPPLTTAQYHALAALDLHPAASVGELATYLLCDKANVSGLIDRLSEAGLATRTRDGQDKRRVVLELTPSGQDVLQRAAQARLTALTQALQPLQDEGERHAHEVLERLVDLLKAATEPGG